MNAKHLLLLAALSVPHLAACSAAPTSGDPESAEGAEGAIIVTGEGRAVLNGLRARVEEDFANVASLKGMKLVFLFRTEKGSFDRFKSDGKRAFIAARILKRDADGHEFPLADADFKGSAFEKRITLGAFDGPDVFAALEKHDDGEWLPFYKDIPATKTEKATFVESYAVGPTDVVFEPWAADYGLPTAWFDSP